MKRPHPADLAVALCLAVVALVLWLLLRETSIDDAYITYRYAANLAGGHGLVFNAGENVLSTTSPLYAIILALSTAVSGDIAATSNIISCLALFVGALSLYLFAQHYGQRLLGFVAALYYALSPFTVGSIGMETNLYLALVLAGLVAYVHRRLALTAVLLAPTLMLRGDAILPLALLALHYLLSERRVPIRPLLLFLALTVPFFIYQTISYGTPLPVTMAAKQAQLRIGWTDYVQGLGEFARAYLAQSWLYWLVIPLAGLGLWGMARRFRWLLFPVIWAALHATAYQALGVASYFWYYAPLMPALAVLLGTGVVELAGTLNWVIRHWRASVAAAALRPALATLATVPLLIALATSVGHAYRELPDARADVYSQVGIWLRENTPAEATVGVMEVGIMGYFDERWTVDLLGLIRPETVKALSHKDIFWAFYHFQPDYVVFTNSNPFWGYPIYDDTWFQDSYRSVRQFHNPRFWNSPLTVFQRTTPPRAATDKMLGISASFADGLALKQIGVDGASVEPGGYLTVAPVWKQAAHPQGDYYATAQLITPDGRLLALHDVPLNNAMWKIGEETQFYHHIKAPAGTAPGMYRLALAVYPPSDPNTRLQLLGPLANADSILYLGEIEVSPVGWEQLQLGRLFAGQVELVGISAAGKLDGLKPGQVLETRLQWRLFAPLKTAHSASLQVIDPQGKLATQSDVPLSDQSWAGNGQALTYHRLSLPSTLAAGRYTIGATIYPSAAPDQRLPLDDSRPGDGPSLAKIAEFAIK